jgi:hypothetical protein
MMQLLWPFWLPTKGRENISALECLAQKTNGTIRARGVLELLLCAAGKEEGYVFLMRKCDAS